MRRQAYEEQRRSVRMLLLMAAVLTAAVLLLIQLDRCIRPVVVAVCNEECRAYVSGLISSSIQKTLSEHPADYDDFAEVQYASDGSITAVETLSGNVNRIQVQLLRDMNETLEESRDHEISVSLGTASGVWLFAGRGPEIPLRFLPIGSAEVQLVSLLESAGINQTCHTILVKVTVHAAGAIPFCRTETEVEYEYLLTETLLVGDVPESYMTFGG